jgi:hypothetical protein
MSPSLIKKDLIRFINNALEDSFTRARGKSGKVIFSFHKISIL